MSALVVSSAAPSISATSAGLASSASGSVAAGA